ncbi:DUF1036 domain-containing protein [Xanthobacter tagetidis]|uniref:DUF1036 domain-containing protein n=2 Tax=Xanthobacter tagetidis TaxID=60216 RepID=A0A3L7AEG9_9HYPH|nr:DUF1036 domain-containing protein [Xanthobacter tagetidis]
MSPGFLGNPILALRARLLFARPAAHPATRRLAALAALALALWPAVAQADFRLCNRTQSRIGIAIGYKEGDTWLTEGWWNVGANSCETLLRGDLPARFYYLYAVDYDQGGEWAGKAHMCTREKEFTIRGAEDCLARGFERTGFFEVDTQQQKSWTVQLTEANQSKPPPQAAAPLPPPPPKKP